MKVLDLVPTHIRDLSPYSSARSLHTTCLLLDANENPFGLFGDINRYPDGSNVELRREFAEVFGLAPDECAVGNGSDELIDLLFRIFCVPGDEVIVPVPTYGVYRTAAAIQNIQYRAVQMRDYQPDVSGIQHALAPRTKMIWLCSPNNPIGNCIDSSIVESLLSLGPVVVIDEAYADFADEPSWIGRIREFQNLIVLRTLSKAYAMAGARLGAVFAHPEIIRLIQKIKLPYNVNRYTTVTARKAIECRESVGQWTKTIRAERERVSKELQGIIGVEEVFPSQANFVLFRMANASNVFAKLLEAEIVIRDRSREPLLSNCLRVTIGTPLENDRFLHRLRAVVGLPVEDKRFAEIHRATRETRIRVHVNVDGRGRSVVRTGVRFLDHMIEQLSKHSGIDMDVVCEGDLDVDNHHAIEDCAIAVGQTIRDSLGEKRGVGRYGFVLPMDESLAYCAVDLSGRPVCKIEGQFHREWVGDFPTEMVSHWFRSFAENMRMALHIQVKGDNDHHKIEAMFKALAVCLRQAVRRQGVDLPSTKGIL
jgi:histidinol-phosphate aminotransferase